MKRLVPIGLCLFLSSHGWAAWSFVQSTATATGASIAMGSNVGSGNALVASAVTTTGADNVTFSDNNGGVWITSVTVQDGGAGNTLAVGIAPNHSPGATTVSASPNVAILSVAEYSGLATSNAGDVSKGAIASGTNPSSGNTATTGAANELVFGAGYDDGGGGPLTAGSGFISRASANSPTMIEDKDSGSIGVQSATFGAPAAGNHLVICVVFKLSGAAAPTATGCGIIGDALTCE